MSVPNLAPLPITHSPFDHEVDATNADGLSTAASPTSPALHPKYVYLIFPPFHTILGLSKVIYCVSVIPTSGPLVRHLSLPGPEYSAP